MVFAVGLLLLSLMATAAFSALAASQSRRYLWAAAATSWLFSFLGSWSIGLYTLVVTLVLLALAVAHELGWLRRPAHYALAAMVGVAAWLVLVRTVDDYWLFFPLNRFLELIVA